MDEFLVDLDTARIHDEVAYRVWSTSKLKDLFVHQSVKFALKIVLSFAPSLLLASHRRPELLALPLAACAVAGQT